MRIVVDISDISPLRGKSRGIYAYATHLVAAMATALQDDGDELVVLCNGESHADFDRLSGSALRVVIVHADFPGVMSRVWWAAWRGAWTVRYQHADVYFSPKGYVPPGMHTIGGVRRTVVTIHDLIPLWYARHFPASVGRLERAFINGWLTYSARHADRVVAVSDATAAALRDELGRVAGVSVARNATPVLPRPTVSGPRNHIFAMATSLAHKNLVGVLAAYAHYRALVDIPLPLVVCGVSADDGVLGEGITGVVGLQPIEVVNRYATASAFLFLPFIEGFGFPVVEALQYGAPVVCSDIAALREASGGAATYVSPSDPRAAGQALMLAVRAAEPIDELVSAESFEDPWARCARGTLDALDDRRFARVRAAAA